MARENLFRGKHIHVSSQNEHLDGTWVYGYLCNENHIYSPESEGEFLIDPETVCQYTGLTDGNGVKIFENDICKLIADDDELYQIQWDGDTARYVLIQFGSIMDDFDCLSADDIEVVGNIFDNNELMKES